MAMRGHPSHPAYPGLVSRAYIGAYHPYQTWPPKMYICPYHNLIALEHEEIMPPRFHYQLYMLLQYPDIPFRLVLYICSSA